jgi:hypothetical protein
MFVCCLYDLFAQASIALTRLFRPEGQKTLAFDRAMVLRKFYMKILRSLPPSHNTIMALRLMFGVGVGLAAPLRGPMASAAPAQR